LGFYVIDSKTGVTIFDRNSQVGLAAASSQKVFTSAAAFELLGNNFRYPTVLNYDGRIENGVLKGNLYVSGSGDPSLGSWRWPSTKEGTVLSEFSDILLKNNIHEVTGDVVTDNSKFSLQPIPDG